VLGENLEVPSGLSPPWPGEHQRDNAAIAAALFRLSVDLDRSRVDTLFTRALETAQWPGRYEIIAGRPRWILDGAHNREAIAALVKALAEESERPQLALFGAMADKPVAQMLELVRGSVDRVVLAPPPLERAFIPGDFASAADQVADSVAQGLALCRQLARTIAPILITGSFFTVAEARRILLAEKADPQIRL
jgi:dihydrofolate synthase/folylpolyglutamate synthase